MTVAARYELVVSRADLENWSGQKSLAFRNHLFTHMVDIWLAGMDAKTHYFQYDGGVRVVVEAVKPTAEETH